MDRSITLQRVQHVSVARPRGDDKATAAREFYGGVLGLEEIPVPHTLDRACSWWGRRSSSTAPTSSGNVS